MSRLIQIGAQTSRFAALKSGVVQATFVAPPLTLLAKQAGLNLLVDLASLGDSLFRRVLRGFAQHATAARQ